MITQPSISATAHDLSAFEYYFNRTLPATPISEAHKDQLRYLCMEWGWDRYLNSLVLKCLAAGEDKAFRAILQRAVNATSRFTRKVSKTEAFPTPPTPMIYTTGSESFTIAFSRQCFECGNTFNIKCHRDQQGHFPLRYKCDGCKDDERIKRIRKGLERLKDPDTGMTYTKRKIELRVRQWQRARDQYRQRQLAGAEIVPVIPAGKRKWYE